MESIRIYCENDGKDLQVQPGSDLKSIAALADPEGTIAALVDNQLNVPFSSFLT